MSKLKREYFYEAKILRVVDGDTVDASLYLGLGVRLDRVRIRLMGINAPETRTKDEKEKARGYQAKGFLSSYLASRQDSRINVLTYGKYDSFGRLVGDIWVEDYSVSETLLEKGLVREYIKE